MEMNRQSSKATALAVLLAISGFCVEGCSSDSDGAGGAGGASVNAGAGGSAGDGGSSAGGGGAGPTFGSEKPDFNDDGEVNILIIGTSSAVRGGSDPFAPTAIARELESILLGDSELSLPVSVVAEDIVQSATVNVGETSAVTYRTHSMLQYYYWPDGEEARHSNLSGDGAVDWDHVIIASDPRIVARTPGYFALGVNKIAERVRAGNAEPRLLMVWASGGEDAPLAQLEEFTYRAADGAAEPMRVVPAGLAWNALPSEDQDTSATHPTPNGAYLAAASIYAQLFGQSASESEYTFDDGIADVAHTTVEVAASEAHYSGRRTQPSAFAPGAVTAREILFHQTGTSSEAGIRRGFRRASSNVLDHRPKILPKLM